MDIPCVISNHEDLRGFVEWHGIPFHYVARLHDNELAKATAFAEIARLFDKVRGDVMVLARFMQIVPPDLCTRYAGRINSLMRIGITLPYCLKQTNRGRSGSIQRFDFTRHRNTDFLCSQIQ